MEKAAKKCRSPCFLGLRIWWSRRLSPKHPQATEFIKAKFWILMVRPVYLLTCPGSLGLWQPHPAQQVGVAGVGAKVVNPQVSHDEVGDVRRSLSVCFFEKFERSVLLT